MRVHPTIAFMAVALGGALLPQSPVLAQEQTANDLLTEIDAIEMPRIDREARKDKTADEFVGRLELSMRRKSALVRQLAKSDPDYERLPKLFAHVWTYETTKLEEKRNGVLRDLLKAGTDRKQVLERAKGPWFKELIDEMDALTAKTKNPILKTDVAYWKAHIGVSSTVAPDDPTAAVDAFIRLAPKDQRGAQLLHEAARRSIDSVTRESLVTRLLDEYPNSGYEKQARAILNQLAGVGKPFDLEFNDAITGKRVAMKDLRGKVVVIDYWATWCGPCVDDMPKMKALYEKLRGAKVEFIGVSRDQPEEGGLEKLKKFVEKNQIRWPQYFPPDGSGVGTSTALHAGGIPKLLVIDQDGKLVSARPQHQLETIITDLLHKGASSVKKDAPG